MQKSTRVDAVVAAFFFFFFGWYFHNIHTFFPTLFLTRFGKPGNTNTEKKTFVCFYHLSSDFFSWTFPYVIPSAGSTPDKYVR